MGIPPRSRVGGGQDHLQSYDETIEIFGRSSKGIEALKQNQRQYLQTLFDGQYDRQHFESRARIGKIHDMLDLGPKIYFGAYSVFYEHLIDAVVEDLKSDLQDRAITEIMAEFDELFINVRG